jgi:hypothetical protein
MHRARFILLLRNRTAVTVIDMLEGMGLVRKITRVSRVSGASRVSC